jgi:hypothetical protein
MKKIQNSFHSDNKMEISRKFKFGLYALCFASGSLLSAEDFYSIKIKKAVVREKNDYLGKIVGSLDYGQKVTKEKEEGLWVYIKSEEMKGWVPASVLSEKNVKFTLAKQEGEEKKKKFGFSNPFAKKTEVSSSEVAMAGKAWEKDLPLNGIGDYKKVDEMEAIEIPMEERIAYLKSVKEGEVK